MTSFWNRLPRPFLALAPLADVTDAPFRRIIAKYSKYGGADIFDAEGKFIPPPSAAQKVGGPDVMFTEFTSADGLFCGNERAREILMRDLIFTEAERPIVAQFFTAKPEMMKKAAALAVELNFDGIDINMGCPDRGIEKQGAGAALIKNPKLAKELIKAAKEGGDGLPVSVKTRIGYNKNELEEWLPTLLEAPLAAITLHARTRREMSKVPVHWDMVKRAVKIRDKIKSETLIIGNGDVFDLEDAEKKAKETNADGIMLGKAIFGNPWLFEGLLRNPSNSPERVERVEGFTPTVSEKLLVLVEHTKLFEKLLGGTKNFAVMKKHFKAYVTDFDGAKELRLKLMESDTAGEVEGVVTDFLKV